MRPRDAALASHINATRSVALLWTGDYDGAVRVARRAYSTALRLQDREIEGRAATVLAGAYQELGNLKASTRYREKALEAYQAAADVPAQAEAHSNLSATYICRGDLERALYHAREALKIDERTGDLTGEGITRGNLAEILIMRGDHGEALRHLGVALDLLERAGGATHMMGFALMMLSRALTRQGRQDEAAARLDESMALLERSGATTFLAEARVQRAEILLATGEFDEALIQCDRGIDESRALGMRLIEMRGLWMRGRISGARGEYAAAEQSLLESELLARRAGASYEEGLARLARAELYAANHRPHHRTATKALALLEPTGAVPDIERARGLVAGAA
jgi:ATP/maltotriose-dependent transcriptional regulator MalT